MCPLPRGHLTVFPWAQLNSSHSPPHTLPHIYCLITHVITASAFLPVREELLLFLTRSPVLQKGKWGTRGQRRTQGKGYGQWGWGSVMGLSRGHGEASLGISVVTGP